MKRGVAQARMLRLGLPLETVQSMMARYERAVDEGQERLIAAGETRDGPLTVDWPGFVDMVRATVDAGGVEYVVRLDREGS